MQLHLVFDLDSQTVTSASIEGRDLGVSDITSVVLAKGVVQILDGGGDNLLAEFARPAADHTKAQVDVARAFGFQGEGRQS